MTAPITAAIRRLLLERGPLSVEQVVAEIPELAETGGPQRALLMMRLDPQLERTAQGLWAARDVLLPDEQRVVSAVAEYFRTLGKRGETTVKLATEVSQRTGVNEAKVREIILRRFLNHGLFVFNKLAAQGEQNGETEGRGGPGRADRAGEKASDRFRLHAD